MIRPRNSLILKSQFVAFAKLNVPVVLTRKIEKYSSLWPGTNISPRHKNLGVYLWLYSGPYRSEWIDLLRYWLCQWKIFPYTPTISPSATSRVCKNLQRAQGWTVLPFVFRLSIGKNGRKQSGRRTENRKRSVNEPFRSHFYDTQVF